MKAIYLFTVLLVIVSLPAIPQEYYRAIGIRGGLTSGFTYRQFLDEEIAVEGLLSFKKGGIQLTLLREIHQPGLTEFSDNFLFSYGFGGHIGYIHSDYHYFFTERYYYPQQRYLPVIGMDAFIGLEYVLRQFPFTFSLDFKPFFELFIPGFFNLNPGDFAFSVRFRF
jgi:hypothetical protein